MKKLRLELLAVKYPLWDMARIGPEGLERVTQADTLADGVNLMLESTLTPEPPERTHVRIVSRWTIRKEKHHDPDRTQGRLGGNSR